MEISLEERSVKSCIEYATMIADTSYTDRSPKAKVKFSRSKYKSEIDCAFSCGIFQLAEMILEDHEKKPYISVEELLVDIHSSFIAVQNRLATKYRKELGLVKLSKEDVLQHGNAQ